jgi:hypothetical protein
MYTNQVQIDSKAEGQQQTTTHPSGQQHEERGAWKTSANARKQALATPPFGISTCYSLHPFRPLSRVRSGTIVTARMPETLLMPHFSQAPLLERD